VGIKKEYLNIIEGKVREMFNRGKGESSQFPREKKIR